MARGKRQHPTQLGNCKRWFHIRGEECGKSARYLVYGTQPLCKKCYDVWKTKPGLVLFDPGPGISPGRAWQLRQRLVADVQERR